MILAGVPTAIHLSGTSFVTILPRYYPIMMVDWAFLLSVLLILSVFPLNYFSTLQIKKSHDSKYWPQIDITYFQLLTG